MDLTSLHIYLEFTCTSHAAAAAVVVVSGGGGGVPPTVTVALQEQTRHIVPPIQLPVGTAGAEKVVVIAAWEDIWKRDLGKGGGGMGSEISRG